MPEQSENNTPLFPKKSRVSARNVAPSSDSAPASTVAATSDPDASSAPSPDVPIFAKKSPASPRARKRLFLGLIIAGAAILVAVVATVILLALSRVDYAPAYAAVRRLNSALSTAQSSSSPCLEVVYNVADGSTSASEYADSLAQCRSTGSDISALVASLGDTAAVQKDSEIHDLFDAFKSAYDQTYLAADVSAKLELYSTFHDFALAVDALDYFGGNTEKDLDAAARPLTNSENSVLKSYGEQWLKLRKAVEQAYKAYYDADWSSDQHASLYATYDQAYDNYYAFIRQDSIDWDEVAPLDTDLQQALGSKFKKLYTAIYEKSQEGN